MMTIIQRKDGKIWTGDEWISTNVTGWRDAATFLSHEDAQGQLDSCLAGDDADDFATARIITVETDDEPTDDTTTIEIQFLGYGPSVVAFPFASEEDNLLEHVGFEEANDIIDAALMGAVNDDGWIDVIAGNESFQLRPVNEETTQ